MEELKIEQYKFIKVSLGEADMIFSTAECELDFNKNSFSGKQSLENIKKWFGVSEVAFLNQIHSDKIVDYKGEIEEGDALITNKRNLAVGVFTADCVPILLYDKVKNVIAAVHSGWRGTFNCIVLKTIEKMEMQYKTKCEDLIVYIGPHIHECCYEVSEDLIDKFKSLEIYKNVDICNKRYLSLKKCIMHQLNLKNIDESNIKDLNICTFCNKKYKTHSYRRNKNYGRLFSFIYLK
ncbi:peptidoglycan editing factor PgeF [Clostridium sp. P21]|uniref:Purine nucleoside phosphorylase n=1 Tax=Clostridium muellerianum TaxID=2716538 RepID=A0A7Y0HRA8_9CLOT|nr:peptidoglycan editing factor PgeF [Clostridium muellerianum]NMM65612.1 peptidoglycan editing factor PgeF [Clostridium muellerianum]